MALVKYGEGRKLFNPFTDAFESLFNDSFLNDRMVSRVPAVNISETDDHYHIELAAPGLQKDDFKASLDGDVLTISAEKQTGPSENDRKYNKCEYNYTSFVRSFTLPDSANDEGIDAGYTDGVLRINVAKKEEARAASRQIEIK